MKKNGFVSTALIYTFFIVFLLLMLFLLNSYSRIRILLDVYKADIKNNFAMGSAADINVYLMVWDDKSKEYEITNYVPSYAYRFEPNYSYCVNGSSISYANGIVVSAVGKDSCYAYFKKNESDIELLIYVKDSDGSNPKLVEDVPIGNYNLTSSSCENGALVEYDSINRKITVDSSTRTTCEVTFTRKEFDIILNLYKEDVTGNHLYNGINYALVDYIPGISYEFKSYVCNNSDTRVTYSNNEFSVQSSGRDECNAYFNGGTDKVDIIVMIEDEFGTLTGITKGKKYSRAYDVPTSGYLYIDSICENENASVTYINQELKGTSDVQTVCYAYFNQYNNGNVTIKYFIEKEDGKYESVYNVPSLGYVFNNEKSSCENGSTIIAYNNEVFVTGDDKDVCSVYYDIASVDIEILMYIMNKETKLYELGEVPPAGYNMYNGGCTNDASIEYKNGELIVSSQGQTVCTVYFR